MSEENSKKDKILKKGKPVLSGYDKLFPEVVIVALFTAGAYWVAYKYESGYLGFYGLPTDLVEIRTENLLISAAGLASIAALPLIFLNTVAAFWPKHPTLQFKFLRIILFLFFLIVQISIYGFRTKDWPIYAFFISWVLLLEILIPVLLHRKEGSIKEIFIKDERGEQKAQERFLISRINPIGKPDLILVAILLYFLGSIAGQVGKVEAEKKTEYYLIEGDVSTAVVRIYPDRIIGIKYEADTKEIQKTVTIQNIGASDQKKMIKDNVGPLIQKK